MSRGNGWGSALTKTKPASQSGGLCMLFYFLQRMVGKVCIDFKLNLDADLTEWRSLVIL